MLIVPEAAQFYTRIHRPIGHYVRDIERDYAEIEPYLPRTAASIIDIGCGMAGIDVLLKRRYPEAKLTLVDGDGTRPTYGWNEHCRPYGSREAATALLDANGVIVNEWIDAGYEGELAADLVISLLAWGFHFPTCTYFVRGFCIADLRKGYETPRGKVIADHGKSIRCAFRC